MVQIPYLLRVRNLHPRSEGVRLGRSQMLAKLPSLFDTGAVWGSHCDSIGMESGVSEKGNKPGTGLAPLREPWAEGPCQVSGAQPARLEASVLATAPGARARALKQQNAPKCVQATVCGRRRPSDPRLSVPGQVWLLRTGSLLRTPALSVSP